MTCPHQDENPAVSRLVERAQKTIAVAAPRNTKALPPLFRRLGVNVETMTRGEFKISYFALAKRYHPDRNPHNAELMANINAARAAILESYAKSAD